MALSDKEIDDWVLRGSGYGRRTEENSMSSSDRWYLNGTTTGAEEGKSKRKSLNDATPEEWDEAWRAQHVPEYTIVPHHMGNGGDPGITTSWEEQPTEQEDTKDTKDTTVPKEPIASNGGSTSYYELPPWATELRHLMEHKKMSPDQANIFKAVYRLGNKEGVDVLYDLNKIIFFAECIKEDIRRNQ